MPDFLKWAIMAVGIIVILGGAVGCIAVVTTAFRGRFDLPRFAGLLGATIAAIWLLIFLFPEDGSTLTKRLSLAIAYPSMALVFIGGLALLVAVTRAGQERLRWIAFGLPVLCLFTGFAGIAGGVAVADRAKVSSDASAVEPSSAASAVEACNTALSPGLKSPDGLERSVAASMFGADAGTSAEASGDGFRVSVRRALPSPDGQCPPLIVGSCIVREGRAAVTSPLVQSGYQSC